MALQKLNGEKVVRRIAKFQLFHRIFKPFLLYLSTQFVEIWWYQGNANKGKIKNEKKLHHTTEQNVNFKLILTLITTIYILLKTLISLIHRKVQNPWTLYINCLDFIIPAKLTSRPRYHFHSHTVSYCFIRSFCLLCVLNSTFKY